MKNTRTKTETAEFSSSEKDCIQSDSMVRLCMQALENHSEVEFIQKLIRTFNLSPDSTTIELENWPWPIRIYTFGAFLVLQEGEPLCFKGKAQKRPLELLKVLIALGGKEVSREKITEWLWPDAEGDDALHSFSTTLYRLRKLIGEDTLQLQQGRLSLNQKVCWVDKWSFERLLSRAMAALAKNNLDESWLLTEKVMLLYKDGFMEQEVEYHWTLSPREQLSGKLIYHLNEICTRLCQQGQYQQAIVGYVKGLDIDDLQESFYRGLMLCHHRLGQDNEALLVYQRCHRMLTTVLGVMPSAETNALLKKIS